MWKRSPRGCVNYKLWHCYVGSEKTGVWWEMWRSFWTSSRFVMYTNLSVSPACMLLKSAKKMLAGKLEEKKLLGRYSNRYGIILSWIDGNKVWTTWVTVGSLTRTMLHFVTCVNVIMVIKWVTLWAAVQWNRWPAHAVWVVIWFYNVEDGKQLKFVNILGYSVFTNG